MKLAKKIKTFQKEIRASKNRTGRGGGIGAILYGIYVFAACYGVIAHGSTRPFRTPGPGSAQKVFRRL